MAFLARQDSDSDSDAKAKAKAKAGTVSLRIETAMLKSGGKTSLKM